MAGLNNFLSDTQQTTTTMPAWYDQAQQNIISGGNAAAASAPNLSQTTAQGAINTLQGPNNPFTQAQGTLQQISSGAANPWIVDQSTGQVTPNTNTALGGLFQAENQQLNQLLPTTVAPAQANAIGSGNFGSLRGQTAVNKAKADAFSTLMAQQMQAALSNQSTGQQAAANLGNVGQQGINAGMNVGLEQMNAPFHTIGNLASLLGTLQAPTTVSSQKQLSPLGQISSLGNVVTGGTAGLNSLLTSLGIKNGLPGLFKGLTASGGSSNTQTAIPDSQLPPGVPSGSVMNSDGTITAPDGQLYTSTGAIYTPPDLPVSNSPDNSGSYSGGLDTTTSTGDTTQSDVNQAVIDGGYSSYDPTKP